jgi:hypothetical protein
MMHRYIERRLRAVLTIESWDARRSRKITLMLADMFDRL